MDGVGQADFSLIDKRFKAIQVKPDDLTLDNQLYFSKTKQPNDSNPNFN